MIFFLACLNVINCFYKDGRTVKAWGMRDEAKSIKFEEGLKIMGQGYQL
jgi:hypothetical protein